MVFIIRGECSVFIARSQWVVCTLGSELCLQHFINCKWHVGTLFVILSHILTDIFSYAYIISSYAHSQTWQNSALSICSANSFMAVGCINDAFKICVWYGCSACRDMFVSSIRFIKSPGRRRNVFANNICKQYNWSRNMNLTLFVMNGIVYSFGVHRMLGMQGTEEQNNCSRTAPCLGLMKNLFCTWHIAENKQYSRAFIFSSVKCITDSNIMDTKWCK